MLALCFAFALGGLLPAQGPPAPSAARAASETAVARGLVRDQEAHPLAGVTIRVLAPAGKNQILHTNANGQFELTLTSGDHRISLRKRGYAPIENRLLSLHPGENHIRFRLRLQKVVKGSKSSKGEGSSDAEPGIEQKFTDEEVPDVSYQSTPSLSETLLDRYAEIRTPGAQGGASKYLVDSPQGGRPAEFGILSPLNTSSLQALEVTVGKYGQGAAGPEYAAAAPALVLDPSPSYEHWHLALANLFPPPLLQRGFHLGSWSPQVSWSGPVKPGRVWLTDTLSARHSILIIRELPRGQDTTSAWLAENTLRARVVFGPRHVFNAAFVAGLRRDEHVGLGAFAPLATTIDLGSHRFRGSASDQRALGKAVFEVGGSIERLHSSLNPQGGSTYILHPGSASGSYFETLHGETTQGQVSSALRVPLSSPLGSQDFQFGTDVTLTEFDHHARRLPFDIVNEMGTLEQTTTFIGNSDFTLHNTRYGAYVEDAWRPFSRLRIELGVRYDRDRIIPTNEWGPRASAALLPFRTQRTKLFAAWGVYYPPLSLPLLGQAIDQDRIDTFYNSGVLIGPPVTFDFQASFGSLKAPHFTRAITGIEQQVGRRDFLTFSILSRNLRDVLAYHKLAASKRLDNLVLLNDRRDRYWAAEVSYRKSFGPRAEALASFTRSHATSNQVFDYDQSSDAFTRQFQGPLDWDAPNRFVSWGWTSLHWQSLLLSYLVEYRNGFPFSVVDENYQIVGQANQIRFPSFLQLNVGVEKQFRLHGWNVGVRVASLNVTNHFNPTTVDNNTTSPDFLAFASSSGRSYTVRVRLISR